MKSPSVPKFVEVEELRVRQDRRFRAVLVAQAFMVLSVFGVGFLVLARPTPVVVIQEGRPILFWDTMSPHQRLEEDRVKAFASEFVHRYIAVDPMRNAEEFAEAVNMLVPRLRKIVLSEANEMARRQKYIDQMVRSRITKLDTYLGPYDPDNKDEPVVVRLTGEVSTQPVLAALDSEPENAAPKEQQYLYVELVLERRNVTPGRLWGLEVAHVHYELFESRADLEAYIVRREGV